MVIRVLFVIGLVLLALNITGLFKSLRNPDLYHEEQTRRVNDIAIGYPQVLQELERKDGESEKEFSIRINKVVNDGLMHYWEDDAVKKYYLTVPVWENYLLNLAAQIKPKKYRKYEFSDYRKNLKRGTGLCSTHCTVVKGVLNENDIEAELLDLGGHVVITAKVKDNKNFILDPDYGIYVPFSREEIEADQEIVRPFYANVGAQYKPGRQDRYTTDVIVDLYGSHRNHIYSVYNWFEGFSYIAIWIIPMLLMLPFVWVLYSKEK